MRCKRNESNVYTFCSLNPMSAGQKSRLLIFLFWETLGYLVSMVSLVCVCVCVF